MDQPTVKVGFCANVGTASSKEKARVRRIVFFILQLSTADSKWQGRSEHKTFFRWLRFMFWMKPGRSAILQSALYRLLRRWRTARRENTLQLLRPPTWHCQL